jgi:hypothetical protein
MINPALGGPVPGEILENPRNGNGYWAFVPEEPSSFADHVELMGADGEFLETKEVLDTAFENGSVLVRGEPGAGKSHLVREIQTLAVANNVPVFCLTTHISAGKATGIENAREPFAAFSEAVGEDGEGVVILDNIDYLGYRGTSRTRGASTKFANAASEFMDELLADGRFAVVGTAHNDEWREAHWKWDDPAIDDKAKEVLDKFDSEVVFEGKMSLMGLVHVIMGKNGKNVAAANAAAAERGEDPAVRPINIAQAARVVRGLRGTGRANFFHANHLDPDYYLKDPEAALAKIQEGRDKRTGQA